ncbi:PCYCGC motif-containing (lipo)protein [Thermoflavimicrobium dichotomicum]
MVLAISGLMGCSTQTEPMDHAEEKHQQTNHISGDLRETTANAKTMPSFLKDLDPKVTQVYQIAAQYADTLDWIPCYCGCGQSANHKSNRECFIHEIKKDGKVVWDSHGTQCGTCMDIALESAMLKKQGKSNKEIRQFIDSKYKKGFAPPTPTPMPHS